LLFGWYRFHSAQTERQIAGEETSLMPGFVLLSKQEG
jgi:hypothetical protein